MVTKSIYQWYDDVYKTMPEEWHIKLLLRLSPQNQAILHALHFVNCAFIKKRLKADVLRTKWIKSVITVPASLNVSIKFTMTEGLENTYQKEQ